MTIPLTPRQADNLLYNLKTVAPHYGHPSILEFFVALAADRMTGDRLLTVLEHLGAGMDTAVALSMDLHPPIAGKAAEIGLEMIAHASIRVIYYRVAAQRLVRELARMLAVSPDSARCLLSRPEGLGYKAYMQSPQWEVKRSQTVQGDGNRCRKCGRIGKLEVHHISYIRLGQERPEDLMTLCHDCHKVMDQRSGYGKGRKEARRVTR